MSRIGLKPIEIPNGVEVKIDENNLVEVKGPKGSLKEKFDPKLDIKIEDNIITVNRPDETKNTDHYMD